jgi:hypothetical protein
MHCTTLAEGDVIQIKIPQSEEVTWVEVELLRINENGDMHLREHFIRS